MPNVRERRLAAAIEESLASKLKVESLDDKYWGSIEITEFEEGELRIFCTCPDCEQLANHLGEWMKEAEWNYDIAIIKRDGNHYDTNAKEKRIVIRRVLS